MRAAWEAAPAFGLAPEQIDILSRSENVVCNLTMPDGEHLVMRLHRAGYNSLDELESEVQWVAALRDCGLPVPTAVPTVSGAYYDTVQIDHQPIHVGVVEWVRGRNLTGRIHSSEDAQEIYSRIGALCARAHGHSNSWSCPAGFIRRRWDADGFVGETPHWGRFWDVEAVGAEQRTLFAHARDVLAAELSSLPTSGDHFGLIHADLHLDNLMADGDELTIIDFDDSGFGWFAYDLAVALHPMLSKPWFEDARNALLAGYRTLRRFGEDEDSWIDTFLALRCLMNVGWLDARRELPGYKDFDDTVTLAERTVAHYLSRQTRDI